MNETQKTYVRFELGRRIEHILLIASFTTLALTGLPQKFSTAGVSDFIIRVFGGITNIRVVHHAAAVVFMLEAVYHLVVIGYKLYVLQFKPSMLPGTKDVQDAIQAFAYNLGLTKRQPRMGRYTFQEKLEYWALVWGLVVMAFTGFMLWNPIATTSVLPGVVIPAAKTAHGWEAVLAVLALLIWHTYNVHIKHFNKSIWTGKLTREEMEEEYPLELEEIEKADQINQRENALIEKRRKIYFPLAAVISFAFLFGIYKFVTFEVTAITTVPPAESAPVIQVQTPTPLPTEEPTPTSAVPAAGANLTWTGVIGPLFQQKCGACHGQAGGLNLSDYAAALEGGTKGPVIIPGNVDGSPLVALQAAGGHPGQLSAEELDLVKNWILAGAPQ